MINKISIIGSGNTGSTLAHLIMLKNLGDVVLFDIVNGLPQGKALDLCQSKYIEGIDNKIFGSNDYSDIIHSDIVIVTAGISKKYGINNNELIEINARIMLTVGAAIKEHCPNAFIICITNPLHITIKVLQETIGAQNNMILGINGIIDVARFCTYLSWEFDISVKNIQSYILGGQGEMIVPLIKMTTIGGVSLQSLINNNKITQYKLDKLIYKTKYGEEEISYLLKTNSSFYSISSSVISVIESYFLDKKKIFCCTVKVNIGQYGLCSSIFLGVPVKIGIGGIEEILEFKLSKEEQLDMEKSINYIIKLNQKFDKILH